jgi:hypothetical protein
LAVAVPEPLPTSQKSRNRTTGVANATIKAIVAVLGPDDFSAMKRKPFELGQCQRR